MRKIIKILNQLTLIIALMSFIGAVFYWFFNLKLFSIYFITLLSLISYWIILHITKKINTKNEIKKIKQDTGHLSNFNKKYSKKYIIATLSILFSFFLLASFFILFNSRSRSALISPWQSVPGYFFILISLFTFFLIILISLKSKLNLFFIILFNFLLNSVAIVVYKFGFGFDFFIHQSTMELIDTLGVVNPKPFYYLGQYSLVLIFHKIFLIPIYYLHLLFVPLLASILIPVSLYQFLQNKFSSQTNIYLTILIFSSLPLGIFFSTTPQNLAYLFLILIIMHGLHVNNYFDIAYISVLALATLSVHAIAGIPAIFLVLTIITYHSDFKDEIKKHFYKILFITSSLSLPLAFFILNKISNQINQTPLPNKEFASNFLKTITDKFIISLPKQETAILNFIYFLSNNFIWLIALVLAIGFYATYQYKNKFKIYKFYALLSLSFFLSFLIANNISFSYLISYEQSAFLNRILLISLLLLIPYFLLGIFVIIDSLSKKRKIIQIIFIIFLTILVPSFLYLNYPRLDNYHNSHGYSVSQSDIDAVHYIDKNTSGDYIVLANQQTSVAALHEFGFKKYYQTNQGQNIFYYPIPTGDPLYKYFLDMVNKKPTRKTMLEAMNLAGVKTGYFVISKYWWAFPKIIEEAKIEADSWQSIDNGEIFVFKFNK